MNLAAAEHEAAPSGAAEQTAWPMAARLLAWPGVLALAMIGISMILLQVPQSWYGRDWSEFPAPADPVEAGMLFGIYAALAIVWALAARLAWRSVPEQSRIQVDGISYMWLAGLTALGAAGSALAFAVIIQRIGLDGVVQAFQHGEANNLKDALYSDYHAGPFSLRYCNIVTTPCWLYIVANRKDRRARSLFGLLVSVCSLFADVAISHRLALLAAACIYAIIHFRAGGRIRWRAAILYLLAAFALQTLFNASRNANFYDAIGLSNPISASIAEIISYLASPAQGALTASAMLWTNNYGLSTGISSRLVTNSSLLSLVQQFGFSGLPILIGISAVFSFLYTRQYLGDRIENVATAGVIGYAFFEIYRLFFFFEGIFWTLLIVSLAGSWLCRRLAMAFISAPPTPRRLQPPLPSGPS